MPIAFSVQSSLLKMDCGTTFSKSSDSLNDLMAEMSLLDEPILMKSSHQQSLKQEADPQSSKEHIESRDKSISIDSTSTLILPQPPSKPKITPSPRFRRLPKLTPSKTTQVIPLPPSRIPKPPSSSPNHAHGSISRTSSLVSQSHHGRLVHPLLKKSTNVNNAVTIE